MTFKYNRGVRNIYEDIITSSNVAKCNKLVDMNKLKIKIAKNCFTCQLTSIYNY